MKEKRNRIMASNAGKFYVNRKTEDGSGSQTYGPFGTRRSAEGFIRRGEQGGFPADGLAPAFEKAVKDGTIPAGELLGKAEAASGGEPS